MKKIKLSHNKFAFVDDEDFEKTNQFTWSTFANQTSRTYYAVRNVWGNKNIYMHRFILEAQKGQSIDHINGNGLDNRKTNLRIANKSQNGLNRGKQINNTTGYKGVDFFRGKAYRAKIQIGNKAYHLGLFATKKEAAKAYNEAAIKYGKNFAMLNHL